MKYQYILMSIRIIIIIFKGNSIVEMDQMTSKAKDTHTHKKTHNLASYKWRICELSI